MVNRNRVKNFRLTVGLLVCTASGIGAYYLPGTQVTAKTGLSAPTAAPPPKVKYSEFPHSVKAHQQECANCHKFPSENWNKVRTGDAAFADITEYPKHDSCLSCHKQQFFKGRPPKICSICHVNPGPRDSTRHPFPNPREIFDLSKKGKTATSDWVVGFPHDKHIEIVSRNDRPDTGFVRASFVRGSTRPAGEESCSVCHQTLSPQGDSPDEFVTPAPPKLGDAFWLKKGTFKSAPIGHTTCFTCHSADSGMLPGPSDCATCHKLKPEMPKADFDEKLAKSMKIVDKRMMDSWRRRDSSGKFQHAFMAHVDMECAMCHTVTEMNTADPLTKKVKISSCATCHVTATASDGGALNIEVEARTAKPAFQCVKCHIVFGKLPIPESHSAAIAAGK